MSTGSIWPGKASATGRSRRRAGRPTTRAISSGSYLYGYLNRVRSSRGLEREAARNLEVIWLLRKLRPDFKTIADFRRDNANGIKAVGASSCSSAASWRYVGELVAIDSTKIKGQNAKGKNYSPGKVQVLLAELEKKVSAYLAELEESDRAGGEERAAPPSA